MAITINQPEKLLTFDRLLFRLQNAGSIRMYIGPVEILGMYDHITRTHTWSAEYAMRNDHYIAELLEKYPTPL